MDFIINIYRIKINIYGCNAILYKYFYFVDALLKYTHIGQINSHGCKTN